MTSEASQPISQCRRVPLIALISIQSDFSDFLPSEHRIAGVKQSPNYSMELCLNVTLFRAWPSEPHNRSAHLNYSSSFRCQTTTIQHKSGAPLRGSKKNEKFHSEQKSFNEWKHGSRTPLQLTSTPKVFFLAMNGVLYMNGRTSIVEVGLFKEIVIKFVGNAVR